MDPSATAWHDWYNAEIYAAYVDEYPIYSELNRITADLAELEAARRVLDLACGTGATARACLPLLPRDAELVGVDGAEAMVGVARAQVGDPRCRFRVAAAAAVDRAVEGLFDRAVCNTAFWQFPAVRPVLEAVARVLEPGAIFVFNVPAELVVGEMTPIHPFQAALARVVERERGAAFAPGQTPIDGERLRAWLDAAGLEWIDRRRHVYHGRQRELTELMRIPAMIGPLTPDLDPATRQRLIDRAAARVDPEAPVEVPWIYFRARRRASTTLRSIVPRSVKIPSGRSKTDQSKSRP
ncbi:MAG: class I SAM-dependent methyltransferase [Acidobacteriota bacterium]